MDGYHFFVSLKQSRWWRWNPLKEKVKGHGSTTSRIKDPIHPPHESVRYGPKIMEKNRQYYIIIIIMKKQKKAITIGGDAGYSQ